MNEYVVAVKRERRVQIGADWVEVLRDVPGVQITASVTRRRATVRATFEGVHELEVRVGAFCRIEPVLEHRTHAYPD